MTIRDACSTPDTRPSIGDVCMSASGQEAFPYAVRFMSAFHPIATKSRTCRRQRRCVVAGLISTT